MAVKKVFSGSEILAMALQAKIEDAGIKTIVKNNTQSAIASGFGTLGTAVEVFIDEKDAAKAEKIIEDFKMGL